MTTYEILRKKIVKGKKTYKVGGKTSKNVGNQWTEKNRGKVKKWKIEEKNIWLLRKGEKLIEDFSFLF